MNRTNWPARLDATAKALAANHFGVSVHASGADAAEYLVSVLLGPDWRGVVNFGSSVSLEAAGVVEKLKTLQGAELVPTHDPDISMEERSVLRRERYLCDLYLASCNAVVTDGRLVNLDGLGNRVASIHYGPHKVALLVGRNKLCDTLDAAVDRVRNVAAPMNSKKRGYANPCAKTGRCMDCDTPTRICTVWTVTEKSRPRGRIHILLADEDLGF